MAPVEQDTITDVRPRADVKDVESDLRIVDAPHRFGAHQSVPWRFSFGYLGQTVRSGLPLLVSDLLAFAGAALLTIGLLNFMSWSGPVDPQMLLVTLGAGLIATFFLMDLYPGVGLHPVVEMRQCNIATSLVFLVFLLATQVYDHRAAVLLITMWLFCLATVPVSRYVTRKIFSHFRWWRRPVMIFGSGETARTIYNSLAARPHLGLAPIGMLDSLHKHWNGNGSNSDGYLGPPEIAASLSKERGVYWAIFAMPDRPRSELATIVERYAAIIPHILIVHDLTEWSCLWHRAQSCDDIACVKLEERLLMPMPRLTKAVIDRSLTVIGGMFALPIIGIIAALVKFTSPGPIFYKSERIGQNGSHIWIWKFRTMVQDADMVLEEYLEAHPELREEWEENTKLKYDPRVTSIGQWLRRTSLDELPQIWNVVCGEMSLVGPRPLLREDLPKYGDRFELYAQVLPGISGLWQVSGRSNTTYQKRVELDCFYVRNWSPWLDLYILAATLKVVLRGEGAY